MGDVIMIIIAIICSIFLLFYIGYPVWLIISAVIERIKYGPSAFDSSSDGDDFEYYGPDPTDDFDD